MASSKTSTAHNNGTLARAANGVFNPAYQPAIPGSQPLPIFSRLVDGGRLNQTSIVNLIETGQVGELAAFYQLNGLNGPVSFFPNPLALWALMPMSISHSTYHSLQADVRRRIGALQFQANYTFGKVLSDSMDQTRLDLRFRWISITFGSSAPARRMT